jgi:hypothetical protein
MHGFSLAGWWHGITIRAEFRFVEGMRVMLVSIQRES